MSRKALYECGCREGRQEGEGTFSSGDRGLCSAPRGHISTCQKVSSMDWGPMNGCGMKISLCKYPFFLPRNQGPVHVSLFKLFKLLIDAQANIKSYLV